MFHQLTVSIDVVFILSPKQIFFMKYLHRDEIAYTRVLNISFDIMMTCIIEHNLCVLSGIKEFQMQFKSNIESKSGNIALHCVTISDISISQITDNIAMHYVNYNVMFFQLL